MERKYDEEYLIFRGKTTIWYRPTTFHHLLELKTKFPDSRIIVGNTEVGKIESTYDLLKIILQITYGDPPILDNNVPINPRVLRPLCKILRTIKF